MLQKFIAKFEADKKGRWKYTS